MVQTKPMGMAIMALSVLLFIVGFYYISSAEKAILQGHETTETGACTHDASVICPYSQLNDLAIPKYVGMFADTALFLFGLWLFLQKKPEERALKSAQKAAKDLGGEESQVFDLIVNANGLLFQNELVEKTGLSKVKVTRILDKLESQGLIERKRRGMTNVIVLK